MEVVFLVGFLLLLAAEAYVNRRTRRMFIAVETEPDTKHCWQCQSWELEPVAESVVRCKKCGAISGSKAASHLQKERRQSYATLAPSDRRSRARALLVECELTLAALATRDADLRELRRVEDQLREATDLLGSPRQVPVLGGNPRAPDQLPQSTQLGHSVSGGGHARRAATILH